LSTRPVLKNYEVIYVLPANLAEEETSPSKSLNFHRFMRHSRECHVQLLDFLSREGLTAETGASTPVANERKTVIECSDDVIARIGKLPFVESVAEMPHTASRRRSHASHAPAAHG